MRKVLFVPSDVDARVKNPGAHLYINTAMDSRKGDAKGRRPVTVPEAEVRAGKQGWIRFSELQPAERRRWKAAFRASRGAPCVEPPRVGCGEEGME